MGAKLWRLAYKQPMTVHRRVWVSRGRVRVPLTSPSNGSLSPQTPLTRTPLGVGPAASAFWLQLSIFLALSARGRRRLRKLKRASRLKAFLQVELEPPLLPLLLLVAEVAEAVETAAGAVAGALSRSPSAPSARSPVANGEGQRMVNILLMDIKYSRGSF